MDIRENDRGGKEDLVVQSHQELQDSLRLPIIIIILVGPLFIVGTQTVGRESENTPCLLAARIDYCSLANNHILDWGYSGERIRC